MQSVHNSLGAWNDNERASEGPAAALGLVIRQPHDPIEGWPHVLHVEVRPVGSGRAPSCLDVGLNRKGEMLWQTIPAEVRRFASFRPHDKDRYVRRLQRVVDAALAGDD